MPGEPRAKRGGSATAVRDVPSSVDLVSKHPKPRVENHFSAEKRFDEPRSGHRFSETTILADIGGP